MQQIIILLQLVLALLSNPSTANDPKVQALASQAINMATVALGQSSQNSSSSISLSVPTSTENPQPIVINVTNPVQPSPQPTTQPQPVQQPTPQNINPPNLGSVSQPVPEPSCVLNGVVADDGYATVTLTWELTGMESSTPGVIYEPTGADGEKTTYSHGAEVNQPGWPSYTSGFNWMFRGVFGKATCFAFFTHSIGGSTSTPNPPPNPNNPGIIY